MWGLVAATAIGVTLCGAGIAHAGTATLSGDTLTFEAGPSEANRVFVIRGDGGMHVIDSAVAVTADGGCTQENANEAFCAADDLTILEIDVVAGDEDDYVDLRGAGVFLSSQIDGDAGEDTLLSGLAFSGTVLDGGAGADFLSGEGDITVDYSDRTNPVTVTVGDELANDGEAGEGDFVSTGVNQVYGGHAGDTLIAMNVSGVQASYLNGGEGDDHLSALPDGWTSIVDGGPGDDVMRSSGPDSTIFGGNGNDILIGAHSGQALWGQNGDDTLRGQAANDLLRGGAGADTLNGGPAKDLAFGNDGNDTFLARDGKRDYLDGGHGTDKARVDSFDRLTRIEEIF
jgi:Ca2+-binding RTX toxin-like protein